MTGNDAEAKEPAKIAVQFYCTEDEANTLKSAADRTMRSSASFAKYHTLKAAQAVNEGKTLE